MVVVRILVVLIFVFAVIVIGSLSYLYLNQHKMAFFPERIPNDFKFDLGPNDEEGFLTLPTGEKINYLIFGADKDTKGRRSGQIIYFHGNAGSLANWWYVGDEIRRRTNYTVWIMDYPGFGKSTGETRDHLIMIEMGAHFVKTVQARNPDGRLVLYGRSIGSGVASALAKIEGVKGVILETPYLSVRKLAAEIYPFLPSFLTRIHLDNEQLAKMNPPPRTLIIHGTDDEVVPYRHGQELANLIKGSEFVTIDRGNHSNLSQSSLYWQELDKFLQTLP